MPTDVRSPGLHLLRRVAAAARAPRVRTMREFAEAEIVIPDGPFAGQRFSAARQPFSILWFNEVDSGGWRRFATTGPTQTGKTLLCAIIPVLFHLFELKETVIFGVPTMEVAVDKWQEDLRPAILASRYADEIPTEGQGSKRGKITRIQFRNGATLRFMSGGGGDENRSAFTSRVVVITEADKMDEQGGTSREADKITQLERRTDAYGELARIYLECTVSYEEGRIWQEISKGSNSRILLPCPHCRRLVTPEREHLVNWQDAADVIAAGERAALCCPDCGATWTEAERVEANRECRLVHRGQAIDKGGTTATGTPAATDTLGFRWTATNNLLAPIATVAREEWKAIRAIDEDNATKALKQFKWALPYKSPKVDISGLDPMAIARRVAPEWPKGRVPSGAACLTVGIDVGLYLCHWGAVAWLEQQGGMTPHLVDYGRLEVAARELGRERAILLALRDFRDSICAKGWPGDGDVRPARVFVDSGWETETVYAFAEESPGFLPCKGFGELQQARKESKEMEALGYCAAALPGRPGVMLVDLNADRWKGYVHARLSTPIGQPGGMTLYNAPAVEHLSLAKHFTAEKQVQEFVAGRGLVTKFVKVHQNNHFLDAVALACAAGHSLGMRQVGEAPADDAGKRGKREVRRADWMGAPRKDWIT